MDWARSNKFRAVVVALMVVFVGLQVAQRDWPWAAIATFLLVLNLALWRRHRASEPRAGSTPSGFLSSSFVSERGVSATLAELLDRPGVAEAWSAGPAVWRQVSYLDEVDDLALPAAEVAEYVWITTRDDARDAYMTVHWSVSVADELKGLLDLDVEEDEDPLVATVADHPAVAEVGHTDRELYDVALCAPLTLDAMAALAARGLIAHHLDAVRRLLPSG